MHRCSCQYTRERDTGPELIKLKLFGLQKLILSNVILLKLLPYASLPVFLISIKENRLYF
jgi:hypothetical protein